MNQLHDKEAVTVVLSPAEDGNDVRVPELPCETRFLFEPTDPGGGEADGPGEHLQGDDVTGLQIPSPKDDSHTPAADFFEQFALAEAGEGEGAGHIPPQGAGFAIEPRVFEHGKDGKDFLNSGRVRGKTTSEAFDRGPAALAEFFNELGGEQFEGDA